MSVIPNTGGPTVSENPEQMDAKRRAEEAFAQRGEDADYEKASQEFMQGLGMNEFNPEREVAAREFVAAEESTEENPDEELFAKLEDAEHELDQAQESESHSDRIGSEISSENHGLETSGVIDGETLPAETENNGLESNEIQTESITGEYNALFEKFAREGKITLEDLSMLQEGDISSENYNTVISGLEIDDDKKNELIGALDYLNNPARISEAQSELNTEFADVFRESQINPAGKEVIWKTDFHANAFAEVSLHYTGGETKTPEERNEDLSLALSMAAESLGKGAQININAGNTETFNKNMAIARNFQNSSKQRFEALAQVSLITNRVDGIKGMGKSKEQLRINASRKIAEKGQLENFIALTRQYQNQSNEQAKQGIAEQIHEITQEAGVTSGEASSLTGGELDIFSDTLQDTPGETA